MDKINVHNSMDFNHWTTGFTKPLPNGLWPVTFLQPITVHETKVLKNWNRWSKVTGHTPLGKDFVKSTVNLFGKKIVGPHPQVYIQTIRFCLSNQIHLVICISKICLAIVIKKYQLQFPRWMTDLSYLQVILQFIHGVMFNTRRFVRFTKPPHIQSYNPVIRWVLTDMYPIIHFSMSHSHTKQNKD